MAEYYQEGTRFPAHPAPRTFESIPFATGSLGHGLSLAVGFCLSGRIAKKENKIFCITSDGELNEGSTWEAVLFAAHHGFSNLTWIIDRNGLQGFGRTEEVLCLEPLAGKLRAFNFHVEECDGHNVDALDETWRRGSKLAHDEGKPLVIIARTIKGYLWPEMADKVACHYLPMSEKQYQDLITLIVSSDK